MDPKHGSRLFRGFLVIAGRVFYFDGDAINNGLCEWFRFVVLLRIETNQDKNGCVCKMNCYDVRG